MDYLKFIAAICLVTALSVVLVILVTTDFNPEVIIINVYDAEGTIGATIIEYPDGRLEAINGKLGTVGSKIRIK